MKILFCKWNGCCEAGIEAAFVKIGYEVDSLFYNFAGADYSEECLAMLQRQLSMNQYGFVFSHNFIPIISKVCEIYHLVYVSWIMDSPAHHLYSKAIYNSCNRIFIFDRALYDKFVQKNPERIYYHPLATCVSHWDRVLEDKERENRFLAEVSFLGSLYIERCHYDFVEGVPPYVKGYMDAMIESQLNVYGYNFLYDCLDDKVTLAYAKCADWCIPEDYEDDIRDVVAQNYLGQKCAQLERLKIAECLADSKFDFKLYTNSVVPGVLQGCSQGVVGYYDEMPQVFYHSKINLNITSKSICTGLPLRIFDIMGCGGFCLTNYQAELPEYFDIGRDLAVYESIPHLLEQITYYLLHDDERREIAGHGYEKVKKYFSYECALREILEQSGV